MEIVETINRPPAGESSGAQAASIRIDAETAKRLASRFILENLPDRFCAGTPRFLQFPLRAFWTVPVVLSYPRIGPVGQTGVVAVDTETGAIAGWTPLDEMREAAKSVYAERKTDIEAAFSQTRNA